MQKLKYGLIAVLPVLLSACNISKVNLAYCPASTQGSYTSKTLKVDKVYDDRFNHGNLTNDPREIGEFSWTQSIAPKIYYGVTPVTNSVQTALHMSLSQAGYHLTSVHPDRVLFTRIDDIDVHVESKDNQTRILFAKFDVNFAVTDKYEKVIWRKTILGEGSIDIAGYGKTCIRSQCVKTVVNRALDDMVLQLEKDPGFNKVLR